MARRKTPKAPIPIRQTDRRLVLMGDVRQAPVEVLEEGRAFRPVLALWVRADDGQVVGQLVDKPGHPARSLVRALRAPVPVPGQPPNPAMPTHVVLFNEVLAKQVKPLLAPLNIEVTTSPPFQPFDDLFTDLFDHLQKADQAWLMPDLPEDLVRSLVSATERLWRAKPWQYVFDSPPFALVPDQGSARVLFASVLGASAEVFGVALYTSAADYEATEMLADIPAGSPEDESPAAQDAAASEVLSAASEQVVGNARCLLKRSSSSVLGSCHRRSVRRSPKRSSVHALRRCATRSSWCRSTPKPRPIGPTASSWHGGGGPGD